MKPATKVRLRDPLMFGPEFADKLATVQELRPSGKFRIKLVNELRDVDPDDIIPVTTIAYQYGLMDPPDWDQDCHEQLFLMNRFWNTLVEIEHEHRASYRKLLGDAAEVAPLEARANALATEQADLRAERKQLRQATRSKVNPPEITERLRAISAELQHARQAAKHMRATVKDTFGPQIKALDNARFEAAKKARKESKLYWANYNAVMQSYEAARSRVMKEGTELKFHRFDGQGRFVVQMMNGSTVEGLTGGTRPARLDMNLQPIPGRGGKARPRLAMKIYTHIGDQQPRMLTWPIIYNRPLPEGYCRIQNVVVTRRRVATKWRYAVVFTCLVDDMTPISQSHLSCGINLGFRMTSRGLRVATIHTGHYASYQLHLSHFWMSHMAKIDVMQQQRDQARNEIHARLKAQWPQRPDGIPDAFGERLGNLVKAPQIASASLAYVVLQWRAHPWWPEMFVQLEAWRSSDKKLFEREANDREHMLLVRREQYRLFARNLAQRFGLIRIGALDLRKIAQVETEAGTENPLPQAVRHNRQRACLSVLVQEIEKQARKSGSTVEYITGAVTKTCHHCGGRCAIGTDIMHVCEHCSTVWDQDENAAINILAGARSLFEKQIRSPEDEPEVAVN